MVITAFLLNTRVCPRLRGTVNLAKIMPAMHAWMITPRILCVDITIMAKGHSSVVALKRDKTLLKFVYNFKYRQKSAIAMAGDSAAALPDIYKQNKHYLERKAYMVQLSISFFFKHLWLHCSASVFRFFCKYNNRPHQLKLEPLCVERQIFCLSIK